MKRVKDLHPKILNWAMKNNLLGNNELNDSLSIGEIETIESVYECSNGLKMDYLVESGESLLDINGNIK